MNRVLLDKDETTTYIKLQDASGKSKTRGIHASPVLDVVQKTLDVKDLLPGVHHHGLRGEVVLHFE